MDTNTAQKNTRFAKFKPQTQTPRIEIEITHDYAYVRLVERNRTNCPFIEELRTVTIRNEFGEITTIRPITDAERAAACDRAQSFAENLSRAIGAPITQDEYEYPYAFRVVVESQSTRSYEEGGLQVGGGGVWARSKTYEGAIEIAKSVKFINGHTAGIEALYESSDESEVDTARIYPVNLLAEHQATREKSA